jgi:vacuolar-type H+-ATPase subunit H
VKVLRKSSVCPNCGHVVFGSRCKWCNYIINNGKPTAKDENHSKVPETEDTPKQKVVEIIAEGEPETPAAVTMDEGVSAPPENVPDTGSAEQLAEEFLDRAKKEAEAISTEIIADGQQKADGILHDAKKQSRGIADTIVAEARSKSDAIINEGMQKANSLLHNAEQKSLEVADKIISEAHKKSDEIINESRQKAERILNDGKNVVIELMEKANLDTEMKSNDIIAEARKKADEIMLEAKNISSASVLQEKTQKTNDRITGRDIVVSAIIVLIGIVLIIAAYFYVRSNM